MKRRLKPLLVLVIYLCCLSFHTLAEVEPVKWNNATDHNRWTEYMLFGNESYHYAKPVNIRTSVQQLNDALLLCIDQYNSSYSDKLARLCFIPGVPDNISAIDFPAGTTHRSFTHRGWNHIYTDSEVRKSHPEIRKQILTSVVGYVFHFENYYSSQQSEKMCDAMGCLLYNIHIIQDRYHSKVWYGAASTLTIVNLSTRTESITHDLLECIQVLFSDSRKSNDSSYNSLENGIKKIASNYLSDTRDINSADDYLLIDRKYAGELKELLAKNLSKLLQKQSWFDTAFPSKWNSSIN